MLLPIIPALEIKWLNKTSKQDNPTLVQLNVISPEIILFSNMFFKLTAFRINFKSEFAGQK